MKPELKKMNNGDYSLNLSENKANYSQRNNKLNIGTKNNPINAMSMCNTTSMCMALDYLGYTFTKEQLGKWDQPEDALGEFVCTNPEVLSYYEKINKQWYNDWKNDKPNSYPPNEIHDVLSFGTNLWMQKQVTKFSLKVEIKKILENLTEGKPVLFSGAFQRPGKSPLNHIVCGVGYILQSGFKKEMDIWENLKFIIVDDPYGRTYQWDTGSGNDSLITKEQFIRDIKEVKNTSTKWAHLFI
jgi:hypothetical protein